MALKDLEKIIADTKKAFGQELSDRLTKAVQARDVRAKADKETNTRTRNAPGKCRRSLTPRCRLR
jgi:hypothetical protein